MKKGPKKPRAPKPKAPKASTLKQKQKQSVNVKIHINNSKPARRAPAASRAHASPFSQPISIYPQFREEPLPPPIHYNAPPVAQPQVVAQGFHGIAAPVAAPELPPLRAAEHVPAAEVVIAQKRNINKIIKLGRPPAGIAVSRLGKVKNPYSNRWVDPNKKAYQDLLAAGKVNMPKTNDGGGKMGPG